MSNNQPIGVFDSGVGGITVLKELFRVMPNEDYIYFGDTARVPYGEKTKEELLSFAREILDFFKKNNVKAVVMACNTSSAVTLELVKDEYDFPVFGLINPVADYVSGIGCSNIGVMATSATINSNAYKKAIEKRCGDKKVFQLACPGLVEFVETSTVDSDEAYELVKAYISRLLENNVEKIILGCTHYPYLSNVINKITDNKAELIDPAVQIVKSVSSYFKEHNLYRLANEGSRRYIVSSNPEKFVNSAQTLFDDCKQAELLEKIVL